MAEMREKIDPAFLRILRETQKLRALPKLTPLPTPDELRNGAIPVQDVAGPNVGKNVVDDKPMSQDQLINTLKEILGYKESLPSRLPNTPVENGVASGKYTIKPSSFIDQINQGIQIRDQFLSNVSDIRAGKKGNYTEEEIDTAHALDEADLNKAQMAGVQNAMRDVLNKTIAEFIKNYRNK